MRLVPATRTRIRTRLPWKYAGHGEDRTGLGIHLIAALRPIWRMPSRSSGETSLGATVVRLSNPNPTSPSTLHALRQSYFPQEPPGKKHILSPRWHRAPKQSLVCSTPSATSVERVDTVKRLVSRLRSCVRSSSLPDRDLIRRRHFVNTPAGDDDAEGHERFAIQ